MANIAINTITMASKNLKMLKRLHGKIMDCCHSGKKNLVRDLLLNHGYAESSVVKTVNKSDHFSDCDTLIIRRDGVYSFNCETTSSWANNMSPIIDLLHDYYQDVIRISFISEEPGTEQFVVMDESEMFYPEKFRVDWCVESNYETEYFSTFKEAVNYLKYHFPKAEFGYYDSIADIKANIDSAYSATDDEYFFNFNKFKEFQYIPNHFIKEVA